jgi:hypothetical protein
MPTLPLKPVREDRSDFHRTGYGMMEPLARTGVCRALQIILKRHGTMVSGDGTLFTAFSDAIGPELSHGRFAKHLECDIKSLGHLANEEEPVRTLRNAGFI